MPRRAVIIFLLALAPIGYARAAEPNETFATATVLSPGTYSVSDSLAAPATSDTVLGSIDLFGNIGQTSDNDGPHAADGGSALFGVPTNAGSVEFLVSGAPDLNFEGNHDQHGSYEVVVDVYNLFGELVYTQNEIHLLEPGDVHQFSDLFSEDWINGTYDVYTNPNVGVGDVDFFTFTGLVPGDDFTVRTVDTGGTNIDTFLGWFNAAGTLITANNDIDEENEVFQSMLTGIVPANGQLSFAVTGFPDFQYLGNHDITGAYELQLEVETMITLGDYNGDGTTDAADYVLWRKGLADGTYETWRHNFGSSAGGGAAAVPEPCSALLIFIGGLAQVMSVRRTKSGLTTGFAPEFCGSGL